MKTFYFLSLGLTTFCAVFFIITMDNYLFLATELFCATTLIITAIGYARDNPKTPPKNE